MKKLLFGLMLSTLLLAGAQKELPKLMDYVEVQAEHYTDQFTSNLVNQLMQ